MGADVMATPWSGATRLNGDQEPLLGGGWGACACDPASGNVVFKYSSDGIDWSGAEVAVGTITALPYVVAIKQAHVAQSSALYITNGLQTWQSFNYGASWSAF